MPGAAVVQVSFQDPINIGYPIERYKFVRPSPFRGQLCVFDHKMMFTEWHLLVVVNLGLLVVIGLLVLICSCLL